MKSTLHLDFLISIFKITPPQFEILHQQIGMLTRVNTLFINFWVIKISLCFVNNENKFT